LLTTAAAYVGEERAAADTPPDPGAMAAAIFLKGLLQGLSK
jgi:triose/dihydroxyacetone kinase / FAD-AMP lyase (cyclizing)